MFSIVINFRNLRDHKAIPISKLSHKKIKWLIWDYRFISWQKLKRQFYIFKTLPFLKEGDQKKREMEGSYFFYLEHESFDTSAQLNPFQKPGISCSSPRRSTGPILPRVASRRCHCSLYMLYPLSSTNINHSGVPQALHSPGTSEGSPFSSIWLNDAHIPSIILERPGPAQSHGGAGTEGMSQERCSLSHGNPATALLSHPPTASWRTSHSNFFLGFFLY